MTYLASSPSVNQERTGEIIAFPYPSSPRTLRHQTVDPPPVEGYSADGESVIRAGDTFNTSDVKRAILRTCGPLPLGVLDAILLNVEAGEPNTYALLAEQCGMSLSSLHRVIRPMLKNGFLTVGTAGGGRGKETVLAPINPFRNHVINHVTDDTVLGQTPSETPSETMSKPPIPPVCVSDVNQQDLNTHSADAAKPKPTKPLPTNGAAQQMIAAYCREAGLEQPANYGKALGQANRLLKANVSVEDIPDLYAYTVRWAETADLNTMLSSVDRWRQTLNGKAKPAQSNERPLAYNSAKRFRSGDGGGFVG